MRTILFYAFISAVLISPLSAAGQEISPEAAASYATATVTRVDQEIDCLRARRIEMERTLRLMEESRQQMGRGDAAARRDARAAIESLRQRMVRLERESLACRREPSAAARSDAPPEGVVYRDPPADPNADRVAQQNRGTRVVERDVLLFRSVHAVVGEQVDGRGRLDAQVIRAAVRRAASGFSQCYDRLVDHSTLVRGQIIVTFRVRPNGRVTNIRTDQGNMGGATFARCIRTAARRMRPASGPTGGDAEYSYTLRFPG